MAISIGNYTKNNSTLESDNLILTKPASVPIGSLLVILLTNDAPLTTAQWNSTSAKPSGFTFISEGGDSVSDSHFGAFYRVADGTESSTISCPSVGSYDYCGFYINVLGTHTVTPYRNKGSVYVSSSDRTSHSLDGVAGDLTDIALFIASSDGGDCHPFDISGTGWNKGDEAAAGTTSGNGGVWGWNKGSSSGTGVTIGFSSTADGCSGNIMRFIESPLTTPTEIRAKLHDNNGLAYPNGTVVHAYDSFGNLELTGSVGTITGQNNTFPSAPQAGEVVFTFAISDFNQRYLAVDPIEDNFGLITNLITPIQL